MKMYDINLNIFSIVSSISGYFICSHLITESKQLFINAGLKGRDYGKNKEIYIPESMGIICALTYLIICVINTLALYYFSFISHKNGTPELINILSILAGLLSICSMALLGFADDVLNFRWRSKLIIPMFASIPVVLAFHVQGGSTLLHIPFPLNYLIGMKLDLGPLFYIYILLLSIFCTNSVNILAGINGLEVGQSIVISFCMCIYAIIEILRGNTETYFILFFLVPFIAVSFSILHLNWYPAVVFVGDSYCYFTGMTLAVAGILSNRGLIVLLFFIPQIINFVYSTPQLFKLLPCPRHRLPDYDKDSGLRFPSIFEVNINSLSLTACVITGILARFGIATIKRSGPSSTHLAKIDNLTLINASLRLFGNIGERDLCINLLQFQLNCTLAAIIIHYVTHFTLYQI